MSNKNTISYRIVGDYLIPNLILPSEGTDIILGKWGMLHKEYLQKHKKALFATLLTQGKLYQHCADVEIQARQMSDTLIEQMKEAEDVTEELKVENQMEWVQKMNNIHNRVTSVIITTIIYT